MQSFNAATLITGGGTVTPGVTVTAQPSSGSVAVQGNQLLYTPAQGNPTPVTEGSSTIWDTNVTTTGTQTATIQVCQSAPTSTCATATMTYTPAANGFYVGNQLDADGIVVSVVEDTGSGVVAPSTASTGSTFTTVTAPTEANLPSTNSGFTVEGIGGYRSITPVPTGISLVPGSLAVTGGDTATTGKFTATLCTQARQQPELIAGGRDADPRRIAAELAHRDRPVDRHGVVGHGQHGRDRVRRGDERADDRLAQP